MNSYRSLAVLLGVVALVSCDKQNAAQDISAPTAGSAVKFFNVGVNAPAVNFYANDQKLSGPQSTACSSATDGSTTDGTCLAAGKESTTGTAYGAAALVGLYASVAPGSYTLSGRITATTDNGVAISNTPATIENGQFYSYYLSGIYNSAAKTVEGFVVEDALPAFDYNQAAVRFVNAISNSQPMTLYAKEETSGVETAIGGVVAYKGAGAFVSLPTGIYDLRARATGASTDAFTRTGVSFGATRVYTVTALGDITATTGTNVPKFDNTVNR
ncbi:MAG: DUF4397 domain-containing protein [Gemmatimonadales bacterium]